MDAWLSIFRKNFAASFRNPENFAFKNRPRNDQSNRTALENLFVFFALKSVICLYGAGTLSEQAYLC